MILTKLAALAFILAMTAVGVFVVRRNLRSEHTFAGLADLGIRPPIWFELAGNSIFLLGCGFFLVALIASFFQGS